jgi:zinc D-Ala-D-Ala carboxypeptidase
VTYKYFKLEEFDCQVTGNNEMKDEFIHKLDELREACGFSFVITSGYRDGNAHPIEKRKSKPGTHARGIAADIAVNGGAERYIIVREAMRLGFTGIGVAKSFIHVDIRETTPVVWEY